ncbi:MAG: TRAP transporter small permease subunit [Proteobacteria bacterium]|nr:TRAP transporter small permease subunit [Pseudomonadota bacterium]
MAVLAPQLAARALAALDRFIALMVAGGLVLVLPISLLLFMQWPLRDLLQAYSREANDIAQWLFALYVSLAIVYATRRQSHLAVDAVAHRYTPATRTRLACIGSSCALIPWSLLILYAGWPMVSDSILRLEGFPDTYNPGYFIIKAAAWMMALLVLLQAVLDIIRGDASERR